MISDKIAHALWSFYHKIGYVAIFPLLLAAHLYYKFQETKEVGDE